MVGKGVAGPDGITVYPSCKVGADLALAPGTVIIMDADEDDEPEVVVEGEEALPVQPPLGLVQCVYEDAEGGKCVQVRGRHGLEGMSRGFEFRRLLRGYETVPILFLGIVSERQTVMYTAVTHHALKQKNKTPLLFNDVPMPQGYAPVSTCAAY